MLAPLGNILQKYAKRLASGSHGAFVFIERCWPDIAEGCGLDSASVYPVACKRHTVTLVCASLEEAAQIRMMKKHIVKAFNEKVPAYSVKDLIISPSTHGSGSEHATSRLWRP